ncbi:hypothetical protein RCL61_22835, partial [Salmonella enterica subsp. enterica serovar Typhimurium]
MNELKKELGLVQGVILLTTSLLGTGVFALPELAALAAGDISLWAWPLLIILIFGTVAKLAMRQPFVLFKGLTFQKLCL